MTEFDTIARVIALTMGVAWASGINLYATMLMLGVLGATGSMSLPPSLALLTHPVVMVAAGLMFLVEFFADKIPGVDSAWDALHTFIRIPAGAALAAGAIGDVSPVAMLAAAIVGGGVAASTHATKAGARVLLNTSPEPVTNWIASVTEDVAVVGAVWAAVHHPWAFLLVFVLFCVALVWILPKVWHGVRAVFHRLSGLLRRKTSSASAPDVGSSVETARVIGGRKPSGGSPGT